MAAENKTFKVLSSRIAVDGIDDNIYAATICNFIDADADIFDSI